MAAISISNNGADASATGHGLKATPENYVTLGSLIDPTKPDVRDLFVKTYGDQGITGFLELTGAKKNAGTSDEVEWYEEGRLHSTVTGTIAAGTANGQATMTVTVGTLRVNDVILDSNGVRLIVLNATSETANNLLNMAGAVAVTAITEAAEFAVIGNVYAQGTNQPGEFYQTGLKKYTNPYIITKEMYEVNGSQATNIGWLNVNGQYMWYLKNEMDTRKRFMNQREMMMLYAQKGDSDITGGTIPGSEGYFAAVEARGITTAGVFGGTTATPITDIDTIILTLDAEGAPAEYAMYVNRLTSLNVDDMLASGLGATNGGLTSQFGAFNNSQDMAVSLGFKSFTRGGYTFHKHDWKLLNDAKLGALGNEFKGAMIPMTQVTDAKSGLKSPSLEMNYKSAGNYSRELEHWVEGGGVLGHVTSGKDTVKFNYRSECNLVTRAANQHVLIK